MATDRIEFVRGIPYRDDALEIPLLVDVFGERGEGGGDFAVLQDFEGDFGGDGVAFVGFEDGGFVGFGVAGDVAAVEGGGVFEEVEPVDAAFGTAVDEVGVLLAEDGVQVSRFEAGDRVGDSEDAAVVARKG